MCKFVGTKHPAEETGSEGFVSALVELRGHEEEHCVFTGNLVLT